MIKLLIADASEAFCQVLNERLGKCLEVRTCMDGNRALDLLRTFRPNVLVLDVNLPGLDGITVLRQARIEGMSAFVLATTRLISDYIQQELQALRADYLMRKPCDTGAVVKHILDMAEWVALGRQPKPSPERVVSDMLLILGLSPGLSGTLYVRTAILSQSEDLTKPVIKEVYPQVMEKHGVMQSALVDRSIRTAVQKAWNSRNDHVWRAYFPANAQGDVPRPSNGVFIARLAQLLCMREE